MNLEPSSYRLYARITGLLLIPVLLVAILMIQQSRAPSVLPTTVHVVASVYPVAYLAEMIGGEVVQVEVVTPPGAEPHEYEPSAQAVAEFTRADVALVSGGGIDVWAERLLPEVVAQGGKGVNVGALLPLRSLDQEGKRALDPHYWLDPVLYREAVPVVRDALIAKDPTHRELYLTNANALEVQLQTLDASYRARLTTCARREVVTAHAAFGYLTAQYGLTMIPIAGLSPESEPALAEMARLSDQVQSTHATTVFFEEFASPKLAETLAKEAGARTAVLSPIEGLSQEHIVAHDTYLTLMQQNLQALVTALDCTSTP